MREEFQDSVDTNPLFAVNQIPESIMSPVKSLF